MVLKALSREGAAVRAAGADPAVCSLIRELLRTLSLKLKDPLSLFLLCKTNKRLLLQIRM